MDSFDWGFLMLTQQLNILCLDVTVKAKETHGC